MTPTILAESCLRVPGCGGMDLGQTLCCGQSFRWKEQPDGSFLGAAGARACRVGKEGDDLLFPGMSWEAFDGFWRAYFDLDTDYGAINHILMQDPILADAIRFAGGIHILRQDGYEALMSFIISQNNNIKRISGIIDRLCETFGEPIGEGLYSFPPAGRLAALAPEDLAPIRCGFRARYLIDAARKIHSGEVDLSALCQMPLDEARQALQKITGVGVKVAECALLFGFHRVECFPVDTWIKKVCNRLYPQGLPGFALPYAGIAQQYLFHYVRCHPEILEG